jgi:DNA modification methylase
MSDDVHPRNTLNDLSNRQWLIETKSFWLSRAEGAEPEAAEALAGFAEWLAATREHEEVERILGQVDPSFVYSKAPPRSKLKALHPATFSEADVERLIRLFTKAGERVLDPFLGSGSALIACANSGRQGVGIELSEHWAQVARERIGAEVGEAPGLEVLCGDARTVLPGLEAESFDFVVTSPPYWSILTRKAGLKAKREREDKNLPTQYSEDPDDLGNVESYEGFLAQLGEVFAECCRVLRPGKYMAVIVSDFRQGPHFHLFHADIATTVEQAGPVLKGLTILAQDSKSLYPFGIPTHPVSNIHHQYVLWFQKAKTAVASSE